MVFLSLLIGCITLLGIFTLFYSSDVGPANIIFQDWVSFKPWNQSSINTYRGTGSSKAVFFPVPVIAGLLGLSLFAYALLLFVFRGKKQFDWRVVATLTIVCWMSLDLLWQTGLLWRLHDTHARFSGMEPKEKLAAAPDRRIFKFMERVKNKIDNPNSRFFLSTSDDYYGVRGSYHLYPENVYWRRHGPELPDHSYLRRDDYIVVIAPSELRFDRNAQALLMPGHEPLPVKRLMKNNTGGLFRVR